MNSITNRGKKKNISLCTAKATQREIILCVRSCGCQRFYFCGPGKNIALHNFPSSQDYTAMTTNTVSFEMSRKRKEEESVVCAAEGKKLLQQYFNGTFSLPLALCELLPEETLDENETE